MRCARDRLSLPIPPDGPFRARPSPAFGEKRSASVEYVLSFWTCEKCQRANRTAVAPDGTATCEQCADLTSVRTLGRRKVSRPGERVRDPRPRA